MTDYNLLLVLKIESGATAALLDTVPAVVLGGIGTIAVALLWRKLCPLLRRVERLDGRTVH